MKTLGEFKKAGLEIIKGDLIDGTTGDKNSNAVCPFVIAASALSIGQSSKLFDGWTIRSFAWRANTGVKPEFSGEIEVDIDGADFLVCDASLVNFGLDVICAVKRWRPHLPKVEDKPKSPYDVGAHVSEAKPIFTQAMADAGELPPVGSEAVYNVCNPSRVTDVHISHNGANMDVVAINNQLVVLLSKDKSFATACNDQWIKPIQTEREKAIESAEKLLGVWDRDCSSQEVTQILKELYDAGLLQTPKNNVT